MSDDKSKRGAADRTRINVNEDYEVKYWTKELGVSEARLRATVAAVGAKVTDVRKYIREVGLR